MTESANQDTYQASGLAPVTAGDVMRPALTAVAPNDHVAAAAYLMKRENATSMVVIDDEKTRKPVGLITEADIVQAVASGKNLNETRILALMTPDPAVVSVTASVSEAARIMVGGHFRHLPVTDEGGSLQGMVDILDICEALLASPAG